MTTVIKLASTENIFLRASSEFGKQRYSTARVLGHFYLLFFVHEARALLRPSSLKLGGVGINDSEDRQIFSDLSQHALYCTSVY